MTAAFTGDTATQQFVRVLTENGVVPVVFRGDEHLDHITLLPGDVLATGTPPGVGFVLHWTKRDHDLEPDLVALLIGIGVPLSMLSAWGWWSFIASW